MANWDERTVLSPVTTGGYRRMRRRRYRVGAWLAACGSALAMTAFAVGAWALSIYIIVALVR